MVEPRQSGAGIYGVFCLFTPLHAPRSHIHSSRCVQQYISYSSTYMRWYRVCSCIVHGCTATQHALVPKLQLPVLGFPFFYDSPPSRGASDPSPGEPLDAPRSPRCSSEPVLSLSPQRAAVWGGRGATARPREAKWSSGVAAVFRHVTTIIFSQIQMTTTTSQAYYITRTRLRFPFGMLFAVPEIPWVSQVKKGEHNTCAYFCHLYPASSRNSFLFFRVVFFS